MSDFEDPELVRASHEAQQEKDEFADSIEDFVEEVVQRMEQLGVTANDAWVFFSTYQSVGDYPLLTETSEVEITVLKQVVDMGADSDEPTATSVRVIRTEIIKVVGGVEHLIQDASIDELGEVHYLPDLVFIAHSHTNEKGEELNKEGIEKADTLSEALPYIPLIWMNNGELAASYHSLSEGISHPVVSVKEGGNVMPFGDFESFEDEKHNFDQIKGMFAQTDGLKPEFTGELPEDL